MNKILSNVIFYGSAIIIGSSLGAVVAFSQSDIPEQIENLEIQIEEVKEGPKAEEISTEVEKPVESVEKTQEKPATTTQNSGQKPAISTTTPVVQTKPNTQEDVWVYYMDEEKYLGLCPSQRPSEAKNDITARLNAIGIINTGPNPTSQWLSLNNRIEGWWDSYKQGRWDPKSKHMMATLAQMPEFDSNWSNSRVGMFIDFDGLFVSWDNSWEEGKPINITDSQTAILDHMASDGTNYLRWLDATYKAKCPND